MSELPQYVLARPMQPIDTTKFYRSGDNVPAKGLWWLFKGGHEEYFVMTDDCFAENFVPLDDLKQQILKAIRYEIYGMRSTCRNRDPQDVDDEDIDYFTREATAAVLALFGLEGTP